MFGRNFRRFEPAADSSESLGTSLAVRGRRG
jgi:hypothetical protein